MTVKISKPAINLREELASLRNQGGLPKEDKLYLDNLLPNGDFSNGLASWELTESPTSVTVTNGQVTIVPTQYRAIKQTLPVTVGKTYKISIEVVALNPNDANDRGRLYLGIINDTDLYLNNNTLDIGVHTFYVKAVADTLVVRPATSLQTGQITFDNVSVQEVGENLVTGFTNGTTYAYDTLTTSGTSITSAITNGSDFAGMVSNPLTYETGETYTVSFKLTLNSGDLPEVMIVHNANGGSTVRSNIVVATTGFNEFTLTTTTYGTLYLQIRNTNGESSNYSIDNVVFTKGNHQVIQSIPNGYDVKDVYIDGDLAREGEAYDYEVKTDGINQWLKPSVEPTATTETVVIGVRK